MKEENLGSQSAFPFILNDDSYYYQECGLTKLEYIATSLYQGILSSRSIEQNDHPANSADLAVECARALIAECNKEYERQK